MSNTGSAYEFDPQAPTREEKLQVLRTLLAVAAQRTRDPAGLNAAMGLAREDGARIAEHVAAMLAAALGPDGVPPEREDEAEATMTGYIGARADDLRAAGAADNEALAYAITATIAAAEALERARVVEGTNAQGQTGLLH